MVSKEHENRRQSSRCQNSPDTFSHDQKARRRPYKQNNAEHYCSGGKYNAVGPKAFQIVPHRLFPLLILISGMQTIFPERPAPLSDKIIPYHSLS